MKKGTPAKVQAGGTAPVGDPVQAKPEHRRTPAVGVESPGGGQSPNPVAAAPQGPKPSVSSCKSKDIR
eukprot:6895904-Alexandrium_andersonii.AAC.1